MSSYDERGMVAPVADADDGFMDPIEPTQRSTRSTVVAGIVVFALIAAAIVGTFLWRSRNGDPFASAHSVPADMDFVVTFDALALSDSARLQSFVDAFAVPMVDAGVIEDYPHDLVAAIDEAMSTNGDFTLSGDILPWIGRSVSVAGSVPELNTLTAEVGSVSFLVAADVRDRAAATRFVEKVLAEIPADGVQVGVATIGGLPGHVVQYDADDLALGIVVTDDSLLFGAEESVADAIAARDAGLSIADGAEFADVMSRLPDERMVSFFIASDAFATFASMSAGMAGTVPMDVGPLGAMGGSAALVDEGVRFNSVTAGGDSVGGQFGPDLGILAALPDDTLGYFSIAGGAADGSVFTDEAMAGMSNLVDQLYYETGIDVGGLLQSLSGDATFAAVADREGVIATQTEVPIGVVGALGLIDRGPVDDLIAQLEEMLGGSGVDYERSGDVTTLYDNGEEVFSYASTGDLLVVGSGPGIVSDVATGGAGGLLDSPLYGELDGLIMGDGLVGFADIAAIVDMVPMTRDEAAVFAPLRGVGYGGRVSEDATEMEVLVLVDY